jgi:hypothetical protein
MACIACATFPFLYQAMAFCVNRKICLYIWATPIFILAVGYKRTATSVRGSISAIRQMDLASSLTSCSELRIACLSLAHPRGKTQVGLNEYHKQELKSPPNQRNILRVLLNENVKDSIEVDNPCRKSDQPLPCPALRFALIRILHISQLLKNIFERVAISEP